MGCLICNEFCSKIGKKESGVVGLTCEKYNLASYSCR